MIVFLGFITAFFLVIFAMWLTYEVIRGGIIGFDLMRWRLLDADWGKIKESKNYRFKMVHFFVICWKDCMFYRNGDLVFLALGKKNWTGYKTWRLK